MRRAASIEKRYYRVREICEMVGVSKPKVFQALKDGRLQGLKLDGVLLIPAESLERYLEQAVPWLPRKAPNRSQDVEESR